MAIDLGVPYRYIEYNYHNNHQNQALFYQQLLRIQNHLFFFSYKFINNRGNNF